MELTDGTRETATTHWVSAVVAVILILLMRFLVPIQWIWDMNDPEFMPLVLVVPLLGLYGAFHAAMGLRWTLRARRFGASSLDIKGGGVGRMGTRLEGVVRTGTVLQPAGDYRLVLQCVEVHQFRNQNASAAGTHRTHDFVVWKEEISVPALGVDSARGIPFSFQLPETVRQSQPKERDPNGIRFDYAIAIPFAKKIWTNRAAVGTAWQLVVSAPMPGADFKSTFNVPVVRP